MFKLVRIREKFVFCLCFEELFYCDKMLVECLEDSDDVNFFFFSSKFKESKEESFGDKRVLFLYSED